MDLSQYPTNSRWTIDGNKLEGISSHLSLFWGAAQQITCLEEVCPLRVISFSWSWSQMSEMENVTDADVWPDNPVATFYQSKIMSLVVYI